MEGPSLLVLGLYNPSTSKDSSRLLVLRLETVVLILPLPVQGAD